MNDNRIATVGGLIAALTTYDHTTPVPVRGPRPYRNLGHPMEHTLGRVACTPDNADGTPAADPPVLWLGIGEQVGDLPASAAEALGWS